MGEVGYRSTTASFLADALVRLGRFDEALAFAAVGERESGTGDVLSQYGWRLARGKALAGLGRVDEALQYVERAVEIAATTDFLAEHAEALLGLADAYVAGGEVRRATERVREALALFDAKGAQVRVAWSRELLERLQAG